MAQQNSASRRSVVDVPLAAERLGMQMRRGNRLGAGIAARRLGGLEPAAGYNKDGSGEDAGRHH